MKEATSKILKGIASGDRRSIAKAITIIESTLKKDRKTSNDILSAIMPKTQKSLRIGVSGIPGVGKSTFIESFGMMLIEHNKKLAVLAVDPTSPITGGSILGDKTRMEKLSSHDNAFIRPSPTSGNLGGVAKKTRETSLIMEAAGYDIILIETVGVGQSEVEVQSMVDIFIVLQMPSTGDELQGIKKGILELADMVIINKADGDLRIAAEKAKLEHEKAFSFLQSHEKKLNPQIYLCSSLNNTGLQEVWKGIEEFTETQKKSGLFQKRRKKQLSKWFEDELSFAIHSHIENSQVTSSLFKELKNKVEEFQIPASVAAQKVVDEIIHHA